MHDLEHEQRLEQLADSLSDTHERRRSLRLSHIIELAVSLTDNTLSTADHTPHSE